MRWGGSQSCDLWASPHRTCAPVLVKSLKATGLSTCCWSVCSVAVPRPTSLSCAPVCFVYTCPQGKKRV